MKIIDKSIYYNKKSIFVIDDISFDLIIRSTALLSPFKIFKTPGGRPASQNNSANFKLHDGSFSEGFKIKLLPQAIEMGNIHIGTIAGKLKGVIPAVIPKG